MGETYLSLSVCAIFRSVINLREHPVSVLRGFSTKGLVKKVSVVRLIESSITERQVEFGRDQICCPP